MRTRGRGTAAVVLVVALAGCTSALRLPWNRPAIEPYYQKIEQPASSAGAVDVTFLGASSILFDDGVTRLLSDGFFSRPRGARVLFTKIEPDRDRIDYVLARLGVDTLDAVFVLHSHYDHAFDAPIVADTTGADLIGSASTRNVAIGLASTAPFRLVANRDTVRYGDFTVTFIESLHSEPDRAPGHIEEPLVPPRRVRSWKTGEAFSVLVAHPRGRILVHPSANYIPNAFAGIRADVVYLGVIGLGEVSPEFIDRYWEETVGVTCARRVVLIHWDDIARPLSDTLIALPYFGGGATDAFPRLLSLAADDGVDVWLPRAFDVADPLSDLGPPRLGCE